MITKLGSHGSYLCGIDGVTVMMLDGGTWSALPSLPNSEHPADLGTMGGGELCALSDAGNVFALRPTVHHPASADDWRWEQVA